MHLSLESLSYFSFAAVLVLFFDLLVFALRREFLGLQLFGFFDLPRFFQPYACRSSLTTLDHGTCASNALNEVDSNSMFHRKSSKNFSWNLVWFKPLGHEDTN